ncbi:dehydrogenase [Pseudomonas fluorescens]|nr:dehydrogenase [Pseudomonas fluorescens]
MQINPYIFILPKTPTAIVWNYKNHKQYELNLEYSVRLTKLINDPKIFDNSNPIDTQLLEAEILTDTPSPPINWGWDELSKIFHIGTKNIPCDQMPENADEWASIYLDHCTKTLSTPPPPDRIHKHKADTPLIRLPAPINLSENSLQSALLTRKTCRSFTSESVALQTISTILYLCLGHLNERANNVDESIAKGLEARRSSPSGGGLNACEGFLYAKNIDGLKPGIYAYNASEHTLSTVNTQLKTALGQVLSGQHFINELPAGLFITCRFDKLWWKYEHSRAYRMAYVEAGHISQTYQLVATAMGLSTWLTGALTDNQVESLLGFEENNPEQVLFFVGCGKSDGQVICRELKSLLNNRG